MYNNNHYSINQRFPSIRLRRNRSDDFIRTLVRENQLSPQDLIYPLFITEGKNIEEPINALPGQYRLSIDNLIKKCKQAYSLGIQAVMLFPVINQSLKNEQATEAINPDNLVNRTIKTLKNSIPELGIITDVALDPYSSHGHDGLTDQKDYVLNDDTNDMLATQALLQAQAGVDIVAPSDMMDGRVQTIRDLLEKNKFFNVKILSYAVKYASYNYFGFREAVNSSNNLEGKNKLQYQMDFSNKKEALREVELDIIEGADLIIIKPAMFYLDIINEISNNFNIPLFTYQVSGEYNMIFNLSKHSNLDPNLHFYESLIACKRAGANVIVSYYALEMAKFLNDNL